MESVAAGAGVSVTVGAVFNVLVLAMSLLVVSQTAVVVLWLWPVFPSYEFENTPTDLDRQTAIAKIVQVPTVMRLGTRWRGARRSVRRRRSMKPTMIVGIVYALLLTAAGLSSVAATLPSNIVWQGTQLPAVRAEPNTIAGQDFAFFTRSPETEHG